MLINELFSKTTRLVPMPPDRLPDDSSSQTPSDRVLSQAITQGDPSALAALYDRYSGLVYGLALKILRDPQAAEDLTQEVFLTMWRSRKYDPDRGSLGNFLVMLTRSRALDRLRARESNLKFLDRWSQRMFTEAPPTTPFEQATLKERSQRVREALTELPDVQRQVLEMAYYQGLSQAEIAKSLDTPLGTVKTRARQGLLKLKQLLNDWIN